ncbi:MAG: hypothetical protein ABIU54_02975 [Candidatus Eisenbacteria bacterium]
MRPMPLALFWLLTLAVPASAGMPGPTPAAPGDPLFVQMSTIEGLPKEPPARAAFLEAFHMTFAEDEFRLEAAGARGNAGIEGATTPNRFRLLEGSPSEDAWVLQLVVGTPPVVLPAKPRVRRGQPALHRNANTLGRATRGLTVVFMLLSPEAVKAGARPIPVRLGLVFPDPSAVDGVGERVSSGGYDYPWSLAGRATGLLALELLHQQSGEIREQDHAFLGEGVRRAASGR